MTTIHAWRFQQPGGPEVLQWQPVELPEPQAGQVLIRHTAVGVNYIDVYHRSGLYKLPLPSGVGVEAAGVIDAVGPGVTEWQEGDRVAYAGGPLGAYSQAALLSASRIVRVPDGITDQQAAAMMLKGLTSCYLLTRTFAVKRGDRILVTAAAGGVGLILCQWANKLGATVIGTVGSAAKAKLALANGAHHVIEYRHEDVAKRVRELTNGEGVNVAYDSVGKDTFASTMDSLGPLGMFVSFGNASGSAPDVAPHILQNKGSLFFTRPSLAHYALKSEDLRAMAAQLFHMVTEGGVKVHVNQAFPLSHAPDVHRQLEGRETTGSTVLLPGKG